MKILIHGINFSPEPTGIGKYTGEMATWLAAQGHEVRVVTAPPYYPAWQVGAGHSGWRYRQEAAADLSVWRCPLWVPCQPNGTKRVLHLLSFALSSLPVMLRQIFWKPDLVWVAAPAFACTPGALLTAKLSGAATWLHVQDYEVDAAFDMGLLRGERLRKIVTGAEGWLMRRFDVVSSISRRMLDRAAEKGVPRQRIAFFPNWVDTNFITPLQAASPYRRELGLADDAVVALFSGTLAAKQGLQIIPQAAKLLAQRCPNLVFVIAGEGVMKNQLAAAAQDLPNLRLLPLQGKARLNDFLGLADMHLLPQDGLVADLVMPSKLTAMLSSGRPVVATARQGTELHGVASQCGLVSPPDDAQRFADHIEQLVRNPAQRQALGREARLYAQEELGAGKVLANFLARARNMTLLRAESASEDAVPIKG